MSELETQQYEQHSQDSYEHTYDQPEQQEPVVARPESSKEQNHRILRERAESAERRLRELEQQMRSSRQEAPQKQRYEIVEEDEFDIDDDSYVEGKQVKKLLKKMDQKLRQTTQQFEQLNQANAVKYAETNLKAQFADFDSVVTEENLQKLSKSKAPLFRSIMANPDLYDRGYSAYEAIKAAGITTSYEEPEAKPEPRRRIPGSAGSAPAQSAETPMMRMGDYQNSDRRVLSPERKAEIMRQVYQAKMNR
jgi:hypothetical protein